ncbi:Cytoplasmic tRNA 2-thiolation protein 2 [Gryganskiella cystojenkinii]|nr:Cytoplasmic tRNA 2-thiolation protein 2 [Gryganskiella cystojenkinii]
MSCSVEEPTMTTAEKRAKERAVHVGFCCKCKTEKSTITIRYAEYCDPCFMIALDSKFKTALRNTRPYKVLDPENVMLAFSGGLASRALIHLFDVYHTYAPEVTNNRLHPKVYKSVQVCHIDESCLQEPSSSKDQDQDQERSHSTMEKAKKIAESYAYKFHGVYIEDIYDPLWSDSQSFHATAALLTSLPKDQLAISGQAPDLLSHITSLPAAVSRQDKIAKLKTLLAACTTLTAKETLLTHFRSSLLIQLAKRAECTQLMVGDSATKMAIQIISLTAIGRGFSLPYETSLMSNWVQDCKVIRPLKDCLNKELELCCKLKDLETIEGHSADLAWTMRSKAEVKSIARLTEEFITGLDKEFPSTAATVCRTAAKLTAPDATYENKCPLCLGPVQKDVQEWKNRITVTTPPDNVVLEKTSTSTSVDEGCCSSDGAGCCSGSGASASACGASSSRKTNIDTAYDPFSSLLCYGCLTNLRDLDLKSMGSTSSVEESSFELPPIVAETIADRLVYKSMDELKVRSRPVDPRESLREQIQEFLIDDDDEEEDEDQS